MELQGKVKPYHCRTVIDRPVIKKAFVAKDANHAIAEYDRWSKEIFAERKKWTKII